MSIQDIENAPIVGNAHSDRELMDKIHTFVMSPFNTIPEKIRALAKLDKVMGLEQESITAAGVDEYIQDSLQ